MTKIKDDRTSTYVEYNRLY